MLRDYSQRISLLYLIISIQLIQASDYHRENLALRHPCNSINKRLEPYIQWTEKLASSQYGAAKDACGHTGSSPTCCTNEIVNSYAFTLGHDLKLLYDQKLGQFRKLLHQSGDYITEWKKTYVVETRRMTTASLERLFGHDEYQRQIDQVVKSLFDILDQNQLSSDDVSRASVNVFNRLILSLYRRFMTVKPELELSDQLEKCLIKKAFDIEALPNQRELLYTLTSGASLIHVLQTLFIYLDADIQRMNDSATLSAMPCLQRYARETLCPICVHMRTALLTSNHREEMINGPLCEKDCHFVTRSCFNQSSNPYIAFASMAQDYRLIIEQIQDAVKELKLVERLGKLHIYLYDMVVNATNTEQIYVQLQQACPNNNSKAFSRILSVQAITSERRDLIQQWNHSLHDLLDHLQFQIDHLNTSLSGDVLKEICLNSKYAMKSSRCTQIDQHIPGNLSQWPLPAMPVSIAFNTTINAELIRNQLNELKKKIDPVQQMVISLKPKKKLPLVIYLPDFNDDDNESNLIDDDQANVPIQTDLDSYENDPQGSLSERLYNEIDGHPTTRRSTVKPTRSWERIRANDAVPSSRLNKNILLSTLFSALFLLSHRISYNSE